MQEPLRARARGRWRGILPALGISAQHLTGKHGPCPMCGGTDRFRFDDKEGAGTFFCSHCGAGDGVKLIMLSAGLDFRGAAERIEGVIGSAAPEPPKPERSDREKRDAMNRLWRSSKAVQAGDPVDLYLTSRVGPIAFPSCLRTAMNVRYEGGATYPAMIAMVVGPGGKPVSLHRTYLTMDGRKAAVEAPRRFMSGITVPKGSAVHLCEHDGTLGIAEGIETALSAAKLFDVPCWSALNAGLLEAWTPPHGVREVIVFGDNDASFTGQAAAFALAHRLRRDGVTVRVEIPSQVNTDWNDVLASGTRREAEKAA